MIDYSEPFYVENITSSNETFSLKKLTNATPSVTVECSSDKINWTTLGTTSTTAITRTLTPGEKLYLRAETNAWGYNTYENGNNITGVSKVGGNIMSLLYGSNFTGNETTFPSSSYYVFCRLCYANRNLKTAADLLLPALTLINCCYQDMFNECSALVTAPDLPAYDIPSSAYEGMFLNCSSLTYIKCLATTIQPAGVRAWVRGVSRTGTFVKDMAMGSWGSGESGIPSGWTVINIPHNDGSRDFSQIEAIRIPEGDVVQITDANNNIIWSKTQVLDKTEPFYVENTSNTYDTVDFRKDSDSAPTITIEYSYDKTNWSVLGDTSTTPISLQLHPGDKVYFRASANAWGGSGTLERNSIGVGHKIGGNIMSLLYGSNFTGNETSFPSNDAYALVGLFYNNAGLYDASKLILPATTLTSNCYKDMFNGCTGLTSAPIILPASTLATYCYYSMFRDCTSLVSPPILPATTLASSCYYYMFAGCTSLVAAPALPATTLAYYCYSYMFYGCTGLKNAPYLPATITVSGCYSYMFYGCTSLKTIRINRRSGESSTYYRMFYNVSNVTMFTYPGTTWSKSSSYIPTSFIIASL